jgi:hypothetical protein
MSDSHEPVPPAGKDGLGNDMSGRSTYSGESESGNTDSAVGQAGPSSAASDAVPDSEQQGRSDMHDTGTTFGADPADDKSQ